MARKDAEIEIRPTMATRQTLEMISGDLLRLRFQALQRFIVWSAAKMMREEVVSRIPRAPEYAAYRKSLEVVRSGPPSNPVFSLFGRSKARPVEAKHDVILFRPRLVRGRVEDSVAVLIAHQPWTTDTLPFEPPKKLATMLVRRVTRDEVLRVAKLREADRPEWTRQLRALGVKSAPKKADTEEASAVPDLAYTALRLEFGLGRTKAVAHWRPTIRSVKDRVEALFTSAEVASGLTDWQDETTWRRWSRAGSDLEMLTEADVSETEVFQSKVSG